ncbi:hypothetical protein [Paludisphaera soli]|uniref:hypothetical protein n=1 Tax=Paludisphaera soli TaxID=2712865 RepID=UPI0013EA5DAC|nr:hypothetical protein [Paludisphaera soli]
MRGILRMTALACLIVGASASRSSANVVYTLTDVNLALGSLPAGTLSGTFTLSDDLTTLLGADLTASAAMVNGFSYAPTTYTLANSTFYTNNLASYFQLTQGAAELRLIFATPIATTGTTALSSGSYEWQAAAGVRTVASGSVVASTGAVPEPSALVLSSIGVWSSLLVVARRYRRRRKAA